MKLYKLSLKYIVLVFIILPIAVVRSLPPICSHVSSITFSGSNDVIRKSAGSTVLAVFAPLQCANCYNYLRRLNEIANSNRQIKVIVIAPDFESNHVIARTASAFPLLQIDRAGEGWPRFGAKNFDIMIIDSCGRISQVLQLPASDVTSNPAIQTALANSGKQHCPGASCQSSNYNQQYDQRSTQTQNPQYGQRVSNYDTRNQQQPHQQYQNQNAAKKVNAYIEEQKYYQQQQQNQQLQQQYPQHQYQQQNQQPNHQQRQHQQYQPQYQPTWKPEQSQHSQHHQQQHHQQYPQSSQQNQYYNPTTNYNLGQGQITPTVTPTKPPKTTTTSDYEDYYNGDVGDQLVKTTISPQTQIPRPPPVLPNWPTYPPYLQNQQQFFNPNYPQQQVPYDQHMHAGGLLPLDSNLPCSAYTDDLCFQQQERLSSPLPKCCNKGIYLTDVCVPGKCSNSTVQLCCFQKFLQAKYTCCSDPNQDENTTPTNMFNRCCHDFFAAEDSCCTKEAAAKYWLSVYEVCYPTTYVDYSNVRFEVHFAEGVRVLDLNVNRQWEFNCTYGKKRLQYAYLP